MSPTAVVLRVDALPAGYGARMVLHEVSFGVAGGEFVVLLGPSGAGKTTLLRCVTGFVRPTSGHIWLGEQTIGGAHGRTLRRARQQMAFVFQHAGLVPQLSVVQNVLLGRLGRVPLWRGIAHVFTPQERARAWECLVRVGLADASGQRASTLSGGQRQRVAIARALMQEPALILADEPVASLDPTAAADILDLLRAVCDHDGIAVLCNLHQVHLVDRCADRVLALRSGRIMADARPDALSAAVLASIYGETGAAGAGRRDHTATVDHAETPISLVVYDV